MNSKERLKSIDCVKGVAILLVVLGHAVQLLKGSEAANHDRLFNYIYSFHMPLFMFISGYLSYKQLISFSDVRKRAYQLLPPFFFFPLFVGLAFKGTVCVNTFKHLIERPDSGLWFFYVLFMISSYYTIVMTIFERSVYGGGKMTVSKRGITLKLILFGLIMFLVCSATALFLRNKMNLPYDYGASLMARHSIFYMSGMLLKIYIGEIKELCIRYWLGFGVVWLVLATYWEFDHKPTFVTAPNMLVEMAYYYITAYVGILMMISICFRFVKQEGNGFILKMITSIGQKTLGIYAIHMSFLLQVAWDWVKQFQMNYWVSLCSVFLISVLGAVVLTSLLERGNIAPLLFLGKVRLNKKG